MSLLASASDIVKVWDVSNSFNLSLKTQSAPSLSNSSFLFTSLSWNHTNQVIAASYDGPGKMMLIQSGNGQLLSHVPFSDSPDPLPGIYESQGIKTLAFSNNSRYLTCGIGGLVHLWDLKRRILRFDSSITGIIKGHVSAVQFLSEGNDIISGDNQGFVHIWNNKEMSNTSNNSCRSNALVYKENVGVTCLHVPSLGSTKVASGYEDGTLVIWDTTSCASVRSQVIHTNKLTGLAFSPKNSRLVATVGLDGSLALVDIAARNGAVTVPSASVQTGHALRSITFHEDAIHTAVGTEDGLILCYDWRNVKKPITTQDAHSALPVNALKFQVSLLYSIMDRYCMPMFV